MNDLAWAKLYCYNVVYLLIWCRRIGIEANEELRSIFKRNIHLVLMVRVKSWDQRPCPCFACIYKRGLQFFVLLPKQLWVDTTIFQSISYYVVPIQNMEKFNFPCIWIHSYSFAIDLRTKFRHCIRVGLRVQYSFH